MIDCEHWAVSIEDVASGRTICPDCGEDLKIKKIEELEGGGE